MTRRFVRLTLFIGLLLALGAATYQIALLERLLADEQVRADASARAATTALDALLEIRASERAYLAAGQGVQYWRARVEGAIGRLKNSMGALRTHPAASTSGVLETTDDMLARLLKIESRIGEHAEAGRRPHAEDLIFADGLETSASLERDVRAAAQTIAADHRLHVRDLRERELIVAALAASVSVLVALLLVPSGRQATSPAVSAASETRDTSDLPLNLRDATPRTIDSPPRVLVAPAPAPPPPATRAHTLVHRPAREPVLEPPVEPDRALIARWLAAADLCGALARVVDSRDLPALVAHINRVLDAQGTIVWMSEMGERALKAALAHGYRDDVLERLGVVGWDAANPAAEAFRRRETRVVDAAGGAPAALVVPLVSGSGCAGVMTVEFKPNAAPDSTTLALAQIFAAQLAGVVAPAVPVETPAEVPRAAAATPLA